MQRNQRLAMATGSVLALALLAQADVASALGCRINSTWTDTIGGNPRTIQRSCNDLSGTGSVRFISNSGGVKTYRMVVDLKKSIPAGDGPNEAVVGLINPDTGAFGLAVVDTDPLPNAGHRTEREVQIGANFTLSPFRLDVGDKTGG